MKNLPFLHFFASYVAAQQLMDRMCHLVQCSGQEACFWRWGFVPESQGTRDQKEKAKDLAALFTLTTTTWQGHTIHERQTCLQIISAEVPDKNIHYLNSAATSGWKTLLICCSTKYNTLTFCCFKNVYFVWKTHGCCWAFLNANKTFYKSGLFSLRDFKDAFNHDDISLARGKSVKPVNVIFYYYKLARGHQMLIWNI